MFWYIFLCEIHFTLWSRGSTSATMCSEWVWKGHSIQTIAHYCTHLCCWHGRQYYTLSWWLFNQGSPYIVVSNCIHFSELVVRWMLKVPLEVNLLLPWQHLLDIWTYLKCLSITGNKFCTIICFALTLGFFLLRFCKCT